MSLPVPEPLPRELSVGEFARRAGERPGGVPYGSHPRTEVRSGAAAAAIAAAAAAQPVGAAAALEDVVAGARPQHIGAAAADQPILAGGAEDAVGGGAGGGGVVAAPSADQVAAREGDDRVVTREGGDDVAGARAGDRVVAGGAGDRHRDAAAGRRGADDDGRRGGFVVGRRRVFLVSLHRGRVDDRAGLTGDDGERHRRRSGVVDGGRTDPAQLAGDFPPFPRALARARAGGHEVDSLRELIGHGYAGRRIWPEVLHLDRVGEGRAHGHRVGAVALGDPQIGRAGRRRGPHAREGEREDRHDGEQPHVGCPPETPLVALRIH